MGSNESPVSYQSPGRSNESARSSNESSQRTGRKKSIRSQKLNLVYKDLTIQLIEGCSKSQNDNLELVKEEFEARKKEIEDVLERCPLFEVILSHMMCNSLWLSPKSLDMGRVNDPKAWTVEDCETIGRSVSAFLLTSASAEAAFDAWQGEYTGLKFLSEKKISAFKRSVMIPFMQHLMESSLYGTMFRVCAGAVISTVDVMSDIFIIHRYFVQDITDKAYYLLALISSNIFLQLCIVGVQYFRKGACVITKEVLYTLSNFRPIVDAYRITTNTGGDETNSFSSLQEMVMNKGCELATESICGCILQCYVYLLQPELAGSFALFSIAISSLTTGFVSALMSYDMDVDPHHRENQPGHYGFLPQVNSDRGKAFVLMIVLSTLHNLSRSFGCALLLVNSPLVFMMSYGGELLIYLLNKMAHSDYGFWGKVDGKFTYFFLSFFYRVFVKVIFDFSGCIHLRHPYELGGRAFSILMLWAQIQPILTLIFFGKGDRIKVDTQFISVFLLVCFFLWIISYTYFLTRVINKEYIKTFFHSRTGVGYSIELFLNSESDKQKFDVVFTNHRSYTNRVKEDIKIWLEEKFDDWVEEEPDWFQPDIIWLDLVPDLEVVKRYIEEREERREEESKRKKSYRENRSSREDRTSREDRSLSNETTGRASVILNAVSGGNKSTVMPVERDPECDPTPTMRENRNK